MSDANLWRDAKKDRPTEEGRYLVFDRNLGEYPFQALFFSKDLYEFNPHDFYYTKVYEDRSGWVYERPEYATETPRYNAWGERDDCQFLLADPEQWIELPKVKFGSIRDREGWWRE